MPSPSKRPLPDAERPERQAMPARRIEDPAPVPDDPADPSPITLPDGEPGTNSGPLTPVPEAKTGPEAVHYEARIQILDAFQYPGALKGAPEWVDRNWIGYADEDPLRQIEAGPCLRVPVQSGVTGICRIGDYVCRQSVTLFPGEPPEIRLEVWPRETFIKMFVPSRPAEA